MKTYIPNEKCSKLIEKWLFSVSKDPNEQILLGWLNYAWQVKNDASEGESVVIEIKGYASRSGNPESLTIPDDCFDAEEVIE